MHWRSLDFLIDMYRSVLNNGDGFRFMFLERTMPLLKFAGQSANLRLYDWMEICFEAMDSVSVKTIVAG